MKITNLTGIETSDLAALARRVADAELDAGQRAGVHVHFVLRGARNADARRSRRMGFGIRRMGAVPAGLKYNQAIVRVRRRPSPKTIALLLAHEFAEMRGMSHAAMRAMGGRYFFKGEWATHYAWATWMALRPKLKKVAPPVVQPSASELATKRLAHAQAKVRKWQTKVKRAETGLKVWQRRVRYYERRLATPAIEATA